MNYTVVIECYSLANARTVLAEIKRKTGHSGYIDHEGTRIEVVG